MLNNRGQSLILFVIVLPILLLILVLVVDIGRVIVLKQELDNINQIVLDYGLDNLDNIDYDDSNLESNSLNIVDLESELVDLVKLNKNNIDIIDIRIEDSKIYIELNERIDGMFSSLINISIFDVESSYIGYMDNNNKRIERVNG